MIPHNPSGPANSDTSTEPSNPLDPTATAVRLDAALAFIRERFRGPIRLRTIARVAHLSPFHFHRLFVRAYGNTPRQMIEELRIGEVQRLLLAGVPFPDVARRAGFSHPSHMGLRFKRAVGTTPKRWLRLARAATARPVTGAAGAASPGAASPVAAEEAAQRTLRILVVEDDPDGRDILVRLLIGAGHAVDAAADAPAALAAAAQRRPDVLLSDIALPGMDGCELMRAMRHHHRRIPGIALTALPGDRHDARCREAGFAYFLSKPVNLHDMLDAIHAVSPTRGDDDDDDDEDDDAPRASVDPLKPRPARPRGGAGG